MCNTCSPKIVLKSVQKVCLQLYLMILYQIRYDSFFNIICHELYIRVDISVLIYIWNRLSDMIINCRKNRRLLLYRRSVICRIAHDFQKVDCLQ